MIGRNLWENLYKTKLSSKLSSVWGSAFDEKFLSVDAEPKHDSWRVWVEFSDPTNRDLIFFHRKSGSTLYYYIKNRQQTAISHSAWSFVQINDVAQWINFLSNNTNDFWFVDAPIGDWLTIKVYWGRVRLNENVYDILDKTFTLSDNTTNYIFFNPTTQDIEVQDSPWNWVSIAEIDTNSGNISSKNDIRDLRHTEYWLNLSSDFQIVNNEVKNTFTPSSIDTLTNKSGSNSQWTNDEWYMQKSTYDPNSIWANAFDRSNHIWTQPLSTISDAWTIASEDKTNYTNNTTIDVSGNSWVLDEDDFASDSNSKLATQQSIKVYVNNNSWWWITNLDWWDSDSVYTTSQTIDWWDSL